MRSIYESGQYADLNPSWHEEDAPWKAARIEEIIRKNQLQFDNICEVGCGTGEILLNLSNAFPGKPMSGYEISPHAYERAKQKESNTVRFQMGDILAEDDADFDILIVADVIEHVEDYISFVKGLRTRSKYKIFHIPLDLSVQSILRGWPILGLRSGVGHLHYFFKDTALATLKDCGYTIIDHQYTASRLDLPQQAWSSQLMRLPRRVLFSINKDFAVRVLGGYSLLVLAH